MTHRQFLSALCALSLAAHATAQNDEADFNGRQAKVLNAFAKKAFDKGFPRQARIIWMQTIKLYDPDNAEAWKAMGYVKIGSSWNPDPKFTYPTTDSGSGAEGGPLFKAYEALKKDLASQHKMQAEKWNRAGRTDRAMHHWKMVLRWVDKDEQAQKALEHREVGAFSGTGLEQTLYDRSKMIERAVEEQSKVDYEVKKVDGVECPPLDRAQVPYITVQSEHFTLHGNAEEEENLLEALRWAERALRVCKAAFPWPVPEERWGVSWASFTAKETYQQILKANQVPELEWRLEHTSTCDIGDVIVGHMNGPTTMFDNTVRNVARGCARFRTDALVEGIGHTFVGMIFNNNRLFGVDLKKQQGTAASEEDREYASPDFDIWKNLSLEMAWKSTGGVPARDLPFCDTASFTNEQRIKAWSFCDYVMRRDPMLLRDFDVLAQQMKQERLKQPLEFEKRFDEAHEVKVAQLDKEWEDFWTGASPVLKAIQNNTPPLQAISKGIDKWLEAFNAARKEHQATPALWSANLSTRCKEHAEYLKKNKDLRDVASVHTQSVELGGSYVGSMFAEMALVETGANLGNAKKIFEKWIALPGYRDALLNNSILTVGMYLEDNILVINAVSGLGAPKAANAGYTYFPRQPGLILDGEVAVADLGPDVEKMLKKHGREGQKKVGFPVTVHFGTGIGADRHSFTCSMATAKGEKIEGAILFDDGNVRTTSAPGMVTFVPFDPLPKGQISFAWSWKAGDSMVQAKGSFQSK
jgi:tetratricopeptide (TPR) repeat protein